MDKKIYGASLFAFLWAFVVFAPHPALALTAYNASGLLGHYDTHENPLWDTGGPNNGPTAVGFNFSGGDGGVGLDPVNHRLFVADSGNDRVLVFQLNSDNSFASSSAIDVLGQPDFFSTNALTTPGGMNYPTGVFYDTTTDRLFVADLGNSRVLVFDASPSALAATPEGESAEDVIGEPNLTTNNAGISSSTTSYPYTVDYDSTTGRLFVGDNGNDRLLVFDASTSTLAATPEGESAEDVIGAPDFTTNSGGAITSSTINAVQGLAYDPATGRLFVGDTSGRVLVFDASTSTLAVTPEGESAEDVIGEPNFTAGNGGDTSSTISYTIGVSFDPTTNRLFVADWHNSRVLVFDASTSTLAVTPEGESAEDVIGEPDFTTGNGGNTQNLLYLADAVFYDSTTGRLFVVDAYNNRILDFDASTSTLAVTPQGENAEGVLGQYDDSGNPAYDLGYPNNAPNDEGFFTDVNGWQTGVMGVAVDAVNHRLFVADSYNSRVLVFQLNTDNSIASPTAEDILGEPNFTTWDGGTSESLMNQPVGLSYDPVTDRLFVADNGNDRVLVFDASTSTLALTPQGENAEDVLGESDFTTNSGGVTTQTGMNAPQGISYDPTTDRLFVADNANNRVLVFDASTSTLALTPEGEGAEDVIGEPDFMTSSGGTSSSTLGGVDDVSYDPTTGRLFVADNGNDRVLVFDASTSTLAVTPKGEGAEDVLGESDFVSSNPTVTVNGMDSPDGVSYDPTTGDLFVADNTNNRVLVFDASTSTLAVTPQGENAEDVLGMTDFVSKSYGNTPQTDITTQSGIAFPQGLSYDTTTHHLFVGDTGNNRILEFDFVFISSSSLPDAQVGSNYGEEIPTAGSQGTLSFSLVSGSLPAGLSFSSSTGQISGTPTVATSTTLGVMVTDTNGPDDTFSDEGTLALAVDPVPTPTPGVSYSGGSGGGGGSAEGSTGPESNSTSTPTSTALSVPSSTSSVPVPSSTTSLQALIDSLTAKLQALEAQAKEQSNSSTSAPTFNFMRNLALWDMGSDVTALQEFLISQSTGPAALALKIHGVTRTFGSLTLAALQEYQRSVGVPATGYFGPITRAYVNDLAL